MTAAGRPGVLLMSYGSPASLDREDVRAYLARVRAGREPDPELVDEFTRRYQVIGGSPLIEITRRQAGALAAVLGCPVEVGMRFSEPSILAGLRALAVAGVDRVAAIILSPQYSPLLMKGYARAVEEAQLTLGDDVPEVTVAGAWHEDPAFVGALARRVIDALAQLPPPPRTQTATLSHEPVPSEPPTPASNQIRDSGSRTRAEPAPDPRLTPASNPWRASPRPPPDFDERRGVHVLMTAHSLPRRVAEQEPEYLEQLRTTADAVASKAGLSSLDWTFCWQSAGHEPGEWMKPDFADLMPGIAASGGSAVLVVPVQFLADHLEILYDVDVGAREQAEHHGLTFRRIESLNAEPDFVEALAHVARHTLRA